LEDGPAELPFNYDAQMKMMNGGSAGMKKNSFLFLPGSPFPQFPKFIIFICASLLNGCAVVLPFSDHPTIIRDLFGSP
jgi:hypothetical protein